MIGRLRGELVEIEGAMAVIDAGGVGYEVTLPEGALARLGEIGENVDIYTRQIFREDGVSLYGFSEAFQRRLFDMLLSVKVCGPKVALALIGQIGAETVARAILSQDARTLARATGVGARLAERIILELKDKMQEEAVHQKIVAATQPKRSVPTVTDELVDALMTLGYRRGEAESAAAAARENASSVQDRLKFALDQLRK